MIFPARMLLENRIRYGVLAIGFLLLLMTVNWPPEKSLAQVTQTVEGLDYRHYHDEATSASNLQHNPDSEMEGFHSVLLAGTIENPLTGGIFGRHGLNSVSLRIDQIKESEGGDVFDDEDVIDRNSPCVVGIDKDEIQFSQEFTLNPYRSGFDGSINGYRFEWNIKDFEDTNPNCLRPGKFLDGKYQIRLAFVFDVNGEEVMFADRDHEFFFRIDRTPPVLDRIQHIIFPEYLDPEGRYRKKKPTWRPGWSGVTWEHNNPIIHPDDIIDSEPLIAEVICGDGYCICQNKHACASLPTRRKPLIIHAPEDLLGKETFAYWLREDGLYYPKGVQQNITESGPITRPVFNLLAHTREELLEGMSSDPINCGETATCYCSEEEERCVSLEE